MLNETTNGGTVWWELGEEGIRRERTQRENESESRMSGAYV